MLRRICNGAPTTAIVMSVALGIASLCPAVSLGSPVAGNSAIVHHRTVNIEGVDIFFREAGPVDAPSILLLHGFPSSSFMFRNLIPALATFSERVVASCR
jgi:hypothetical protein